MVLALTLTLTLAAPPESAPAPRLIGEYIVLETRTTKLGGFIDLPAKPGPWPVVIIHAGSGPTNKDGNGPFIGTDCYKMLGRALASEGIAVLRIDKRGVGSSLFAVLRQEDLRFEHYADDVRDWTALLRKRSEERRVGKSVD